MATPRTSRSHEKVGALELLATSTTEDQTELVSNYLYLLGTTHRYDDDMLFYRITRIYIHKSTNEIVGD